MKQEGRYWVDENGNKFSMYLRNTPIEKAEAEAMSRTLINCFNCTDCVSCSDSTDLSGCGNCFDCTDMEFCFDCVDCSGLSNEKNVSGIHK